MKGFFDAKGFYINPVKIKKPRKHLEDDLQMSCFKWFCLQYPKLAKYLVHIPNGGKRNKLEAIRFKKMGVQSGPGDFVFFKPNKYYFILMVEMKAGKGKQSEAQKEYQQMITDSGGLYVVCDNIPLFMNTLNEYIKTIKKLEDEY